MQQQPMQNQSNVMPQPPNIISTKDHLYLQDMLSWNLLAMKKAHFFAEQCQNQELKMELEKAGQMHNRHYQTVLSHLQPQQAQSQQPLQ
ncbi:hypothetical protein J9317_17005 [Metabacillus sp. KIGAM252]|uniref:Spore coat protein n=1 Tax=Metabacillus flavus TaxID=2823519 RepID=A0ABS5LI71_9BACI|nr:hypothetical protein [Metabacillus flavus]MBS2970449.1 hypothetical protein [Metabacillus flavus]